METNALYKLPMPCNRQLHTWQEFVPVFEAFARNLGYNTTPKECWNEKYLLSFGCRVFHTQKEWIAYIQNMPREWRHYEDSQTAERLEKLERFNKVLVRCAKRG